MHWHGDSHAYSMLITVLYVIATELEPRTTSDFAPASSKEFLDIQATIECEFTLKRVHDRTRTYSTVLYLIWSKVHWDFWNEVDSQNLAKHIIKVGT